MEKNTQSKALVPARDAKKSLLRNKKGGTEFIEKIIMIGLFALVAALGVMFIGEKVTKKFTDQGNSIETEIHSGIPAAPPGP